MKTLIIKITNSQKMRRAAGWSLIGLGVIGMIAPLMPGIWFFLIGGKLLDTDNKLVPTILAWQKSDTKIEDLIGAYKYFYGHTLPDYVTSLSERRNDFDTAPPRFLPIAVSSTLVLLTLASISVVALYS